MGATLVERVAEITDAIRAEAAATEAGRRIPDTVLAAIRGTGLNRTLVPKRLGGDETPLPEVLEAIIRIGAADGSTGWCASIGAGSNLFAGYLPDDFARTAFADPDAPNAGMFGAFGQAHPDGDSYVLDGRWPFASNCLHSSWISLGTTFHGPDGPEPFPRLAFVPLASCTIDETWDTTGLQGTGSHHVAAAGVPIQREHSVSLVDPATADGPLYRMPMFCVLGPGLGVVPLGIARGAIDEVLRMVRAGSERARGSIADQPVDLAELARADTQLRAATAGMLECAHRLWEEAERGEPISKQLQAQTMLAVSVGCEVAVEVTSAAHRMGGGAAAFTGSPLARALRDVHTARQHIMFGVVHRPVLAQALAGMDVFAPPFVI